MGVVLAAGAGARLAPLTGLRPKPLCPVGGVALLDLALARVAPQVAEVAVNLHHGRAQVEAHLDHLEGFDPHRSVEEPEALGTAGALGALRGWIAGRGVLVHNADVWAPAAAPATASPEVEEADRLDLAGFVAGWDGERVRVLVVAPPGAPVDFGPRAGLAATLVPWAEVARLEATPSGLYETTLAAAHAAGRLEAVAHRGAFVDCGTPAQYLAANRAAAVAAGGTILGAGAQVLGTAVDSVVGAGARVAGRIDGCVLWEGAEVAADEALTQVIRAPGLSVDVDGR